MWIIGIGCVDFFIDGWFIVEIDGREGYDLFLYWYKDLVCDVNVVVWGYSILCFDYVMVVYDWDFVE